MTTAEIEMDPAVTSSNIQTSEPLPIEGNDAAGRRVVYGCNDRNSVKGILWAAVAFKVGAAALGALAGAVFTAPLIITPLLFVPIGLTVTCALLAHLTSLCVRNALYHLGTPS